MSCKILRRGRLGSASPLSLSPGGVTHSEAAVQSGAGPYTAPGDAEIRELHERIVEMERALQRDVRQAYERGYREGEAAGLERAKADIAPAAERVSRAIAEIATLRGRIRREAETDLVKLAFAIARRILRRELSLSPDAIHGLVRAVFDKAQTREVSRVRVHPDHRTLVLKSLETSGLPHGLDVVADATLRIGDVVVETKRGDLDATIDSQLAEIERGFADRLSN